VQVRPRLTHTCYHDTHTPTRTPHTTRDALRNWCNIRGLIIGQTGTDMKNSRTMLNWMTRYYKLVSRKYAATARSCRAHAHAQPHTQSLSLTRRTR
jgi:hypothetical protein